MPHSAHRWCSHPFPPPLLPLPASHFFAPCPAGGAVSDEGIFPADVLAARAEKEAAAVDTWRRNTAGMASLADLHSWLFATHLCYSVSRQHEFGRTRELDPKLAATY